MVAPRALRGHHQEQVVERQVVGPPSVPGCGLRGLGSVTRLFVLGAGADESGFLSVVASVSGGLAGASSLCQLSCRGGLAGASSRAGVLCRVSSLGRFVSRPIRP